MIVDFEQLRQAAHNPITAKILRSKWGLDQGADGRVFCSREDIERRLAEGTLEPVLTVDQFVRISQGLPYGEPDTADAATVASFAAAAEEQASASNPALQEFLALPAAAREAIRDPRNLLFLKRRGRLKDVLAAVEEQAILDAVRQETAQRQRALDKQIADADVREPERYQATARYLAGRRNYPDLKAR